MNDCFACQMTDEMWDEFDKIIFLFGDFMIDVCDECYDKVMESDMK